MTIPLDDMLPPNDEAFIPVDSGEFFETGTSFWEFSDFMKWQKPRLDDERKLFIIGYFAALFECALKSGKPFRFPTTGLPHHIFVKRAKDYNRRVMLLENNEMIVYEHNNDD